MGCLGSWSPPRSASPTLTPAGCANSPGLTGTATGDKQRGFKFIFEFERIELVTFAGKVSNLWLMRLVSPGCSAARKN